MILVRIECLVRSSCQIQGLKKKHPHLKGCIQGKSKWILLKQHQTRICFPERRWIIPRWVLCNSTEIHLDWCSWWFLTDWDRMGFITLKKPTIWVRRFLEKIIPVDLGFISLFLGFFYRVFLGGGFSPLLSSNLTNICFRWVETSN